MEKQYQYLAPNPKSAYKQLFIKGTRIRAEVIETVFDAEDETEEELAENYGIPVEAVHEALEYCRSNPPELISDRRREEFRMEWTGMNDPEYKYTLKRRELTPQQMAELDRI